MPRDSNTRLVYSTGGEAPREAETSASTPATRGGVRLRLDRRASGRLVTVVTGLPGTPSEINELARTLKTSCAAGGTLRDGSLELQGDHRAQVEAALAARGIRSKRAGG